MRRWLVGIAVALLALVSAAALAIFLRPVGCFTLLQRGLVRLAGFESRFVEVDGHRIHYLEGGAGPSLLLLHGHPSRAIEWTPILPALFSAHRVIALDFIGYGESDAPDIEYSVPTQSAMVVGFLDALQIWRVDLLGFSMGGWVALTVARDHPDRVSRMVLVGSGGLRFPTTLTAESWVPESLEDFRRIEEAQGARRLPEFLARDLIRASRPRAWALRRSGENLMSFRDSLEGQLGDITTPALLVWGREERVIPYAIGEQMARELKDARLVGVPGCGHLVLWECTDRALPAVLEFLRERPGSVGGD